jgi:hypothetical protein
MVEPKKQKNNMSVRKNKKIFIGFITLIIAFICVELYYHISNEKNSVLAITGSSFDRNSNDCILLVNGNVIDTININSQFSFIKGQNLTLGVI